MKKEYTLKIIYDPKNDEIEHLSEQFSDCDEYKMVVDDKVVDIPEEMQEYLLKVDSDDIGIS